MRKKITLAEFFVQLEKADAKKTGSAKGWVTRRKNRCDKAIETLTTPNPAFDELPWIDLK
jgi:hypothetical protein